MEDNEENQEQYQGMMMPSLNDIISGNEVNPNQVSYKQTTTTEEYHPSDQGKYTYTTTKIVEEHGQDGEEIPEETTEIKTDYKRDGGENRRYEQTMKIKEEPDSTTKIVKRVIKSEHPTTTETSYYQKRIIKTTTTTTTTTRGGGSSENQNINPRYSNNNTNSTNIVRNSANRYQQTISTYTRPSPATRGGGEKNTNVRNYDSGRTPSNNRVEYNQSSRNGQNNSNTYSTGRVNPITPKKVITSQSLSGNKYQPKRPDYNRRAVSPGQNEIKRKTINRGNPVKNVQITHIINSSKPQDFHITEHLNTETLETEPIEISKADRARLKKTGKTSYSTSVQGNIKPIVKNLKGKTTVFQHARGIGMTNEKKENINPMYYSSEIKKLEPIIKEKEKEKVEYMTFRNENKGAITSRNYNRGNYNLQKYSYTANTNKSNIPNTSRGNKVITVTTNQPYSRGNYSGRGNDGEIIKETKTKVQMGSRSQYRGTGNPTTSSVTTERKVYNSNAFFNK